MEKKITKKKITEKEIKNKETNRKIKSIKQKIKKIIEKFKEREKFKEKEKFKKLKNDLKEFIKNLKTPKEEKTPKTLKEKTPKTLKEVVESLSKLDEKISKYLKIPDEEDDESIIKSLFELSTLINKLILFYYEKRKTVYLLINTHGTLSGKYFLLFDDTFNINFVATLGATCSTNDEPISTYQKEYKSETFEESQLSFGKGNVVPDVFCSYDSNFKEEEKRKFKGIIDIYNDKTKGKLDDFTLENFDKVKEAIKCMYPPFNKVSIWYNEQEEDKKILLSDILRAIYAFHKDENIKYKILLTACLGIDNDAASMDCVIENLPEGKVLTRFVYAWKLSSFFPTIDNHVKPIKGTLASNLLVYPLDTDKNEYTINYIHVLLRGINIDAYNALKTLINNKEKILKKDKTFFDKYGLIELVNESKIVIYKIKKLVDFFPTIDNHVDPINGTLASTLLVYPLDIDKDEYTVNYIHVLPRGINKKAYNALETLYKNRNDILKKDKTFFNIYGLIELVNESKIVIYKIKKLVDFFPTIDDHVDPINGTLASTLPVYPLSNYVDNNIYVSPGEAYNALERLINNEILNEDKDFFNEYLLVKLDLEEAIIIHKINEEKEDFEKAWPKRKKVIIDSTPSKNPSRKYSYDLTLKLINPKIVLNDKDYNIEKTVELIYNKLHEDEDKLKDLKSKIITWKKLINQIESFHKKFTDGFTNNNELRELLKNENFSFKENMPKKEYPPLLTIDETLGCFFRYIPEIFKEGKKIDKKRLDKIIEKEKEKDKKDTRRVEMIGLLKHIYTLYNEEWSETKLTDNQFGALLFGLTYWRNINEKIYPKP